MGNIKKTVEYKCFDDCTIAGCPGHEMDVRIQTTSDVLTVEKGGKVWFAADPNEWEALRDTLEHMDYDFFK